MIAKGLFWSGIIFLAMLAASAYGWMALPADAQFPVQWNTQGDVSRYADKLETLFAVPATTAVLMVIISLAVMIDPRRRNLEKSRALYLTGWLGGVAIAAIVHFTTLFTAITGQAPSIRSFFILNGLFLIVTGNFMAKSRSNWFAGIRTPWTLSSEYAWSVANRLAGWGFVIVGAATIISTFFLKAEKTLMLLLTGLAATIIVSMAASYLAWRSDPDRKTATER